MPPDQVVKRKRVVVDHRLQYKISAFAVLILAIAAFAVWWDMKLYLADLSERGIVSSSELHTVFQLYSQMMFWKIFFGVGLIWAVALYFSNWIAGPIYHIGKSLTRLESGDLTERVFLRKYDQFKYIATHFNNAAEHLSELVKRERETSEQIAHRLEETSKKAPAPINQELLEIGSQVKTLTNDFKI